MNKEKFIHLIFTFLLFSFFSNNLSANTSEVSSWVSIKQDVLFWWDYNFKWQFNCNWFECSPNLSLDINDKLINYYLKNEDYKIYWVLSLEKIIDESWKPHSLTNHYYSTNLFKNIFPIESNQEILWPLNFCNSYSDKNTDFESILEFEKNEVNNSFSFNKKIKLSTKLKSWFYIPRIFLIIDKIENKNDISCEVYDDLAFAHKKFLKTTDFNSTKWPDENQKAISEIEIKRSVHYFNPIKINLDTDKLKLPAVLVPDLIFNGQKWVVSKEDSLNFNTASHETISQDLLIINSNKYWEKQNLSFSFPITEEFSKNKSLHKKIYLDAESISWKIKIISPDWKEINENFVFEKEFILDEWNFASWWNFAFRQIVTDKKINFKKTWEYKIEINWKISDDFWNIYNFWWNYELWYAVPIFTSSIIVPWKSFSIWDEFDSSITLVPTVKNMKYEMDLKFFWKSWKIKEDKWTWFADRTWWFWWKDWFIFDEEWYFILILKSYWEINWDKMHWSYVRFWLVSDKRVDWLWNCENEEKNCKIENWEVNLPKSSSILFIPEKEWNFINPLFKTETWEIIFHSSIRPWFVSRTFFADKTAIDLWWDIKTNLFAWKIFAWMDGDKENDFYEVYWWTLNLKTWEIKNHTSAISIKNKNIENISEESEIETPLLDFWDWEEYFFLNHFRESTFRNYKIWSLFTLNWNILPHKKWVEIKALLKSPKWEEFKISCITWDFWFCQNPPEAEFTEVWIWQIKLDAFYDWKKYNLQQWSPDWFANYYVFDDSYKEIKLYSKETKNPSFFMNIVFWFLDLFWKDRPYFLNPDENIMNFEFQIPNNIEAFDINYSITGHWFIIDRDNKLKWKKWDNVSIKINHKDFQKKYKNHNIYNKNLWKNKLSDLLIFTYYLTWKDKNWDIINWVWRSIVIDWKMFNTDDL